VAEDEGQVDGLQVLRLRPSRGGVGGGWGVGRVDLV
jgi:hypothetical protein